MIIYMAIQKEFGKLYIGQTVGKNNPAAHAVIVKGIHFYTVKEAAEYLSIVPNTLYRRLKRQLPDYQYV